MNTIWDIIYLRRPVLNYTSPPICEVIFSGSSNPVIILSDSLIGKVTGLTLGGFGGFGLSWNAFPGALCYNVFFVGGDNVAVILAQCVEDPNFVLPDVGPGEVVVTPVTEDGEGPPSDPIPYPVGGGGGTPTVTVVAECALTSRDSFPGFFRIDRAPGDTSGNLTVNFTFSGTALNGIDFDLVPLSATILNGFDFVLVPIVVKELVLIAEKTVMLTLTEAFTYVVSTPSSAIVMLRPPLMRIVSYGDAQPLLIPPVEATDSDFCEWDGTFNLQDGPYPGGNSFYYYADSVGQYVNPAASVQGKTLWRASILGPTITTEDPQTWTLAVFWAPGGGIRPIWWGYKLGGLTADGVYTAWPNPPDVSDPRPTLEIELFP